MNDDGFVPFDPYDYEKEIYLCKLTDGSVVLGYPNAGMMKNMENGESNINAKIVGVKLHPDGWDAICKKHKR